MSVQKIRVLKASIDDLSNESQIRIKPKPYFILHCEVIEKIIDPIAGFIWVYLQSKSSNWNVVKSVIQKKYNLSDKVMKNVFAYLARINLIQYVKRRDPMGRMEKVDIDVMDGSDFINSFQEVTDLSPETTPLGQKPHQWISTRVENEVLPNKDLLPSKEKANIALYEKPKNDKKHYRDNYYQQSKPSGFSDVQSQSTSYRAYEYKKPKPNAVTEKLIEQARLSVGLNKRRLLNV